MSNFAPITVVSGLPRSGTSLMMQMLAAGGIPALTDGLRQADEDNPLGYYELEAVKRLREDHSCLADAAGKAVKVIHILLPQLPADREYRIVFMTRDLEETLASQKAMLERNGKRGANLPPQKLLNVYRQQLRLVESQLEARPECRLLKLDYPECVRDPAVAAHAVNEFLGGGLNEAAMVATVDPALYRQRAGALVS